MNVRCALRLRCRGPRAGRPGGPGICTPARAPGSVPSLVAPLSLSRPAFPRGAGTASRLKRRALERASSSSVAVLAVAPLWHPGSPGSRQGPCGWGGRPGRPGDSCGLRRESVAAGARAGAPLTRGMGRSGCGFRAGTGRLSWADAGVGSVAPESRPGACRAPFLLGVEQVPGRQRRGCSPSAAPAPHHWPGTPDPREASAAHRGTPSSPAPWNLGTPAPLAPLAP